MLCIFSLSLPCSWTWPKKNIIMLTGLTLIVTANVKRAINDVPPPRRTTRVYLLTHWPRLNYVISPFPSISNTSSSKLIHRRDNQKKPHHHISLYHHLDPRILPSLLLLQVNCSCSHPLPTLLLTQQIPIFQSSHLSSCSCINQSIPLSIHTCYYFPQLKNQTSQIKWTIPSPLSVQSTPCLTLEQNSLKEFLYILSPNPLPFLSWTLSNQDFASATSLKRFLLGSSVTFILKNPMVRSQFTWPSSSTWPVASPALHETHSFCGFQDTVLSWSFFFSLVVAYSFSVSFSGSSSSLPSLKVFSTYMYFFGWSHSVS